ncbi:hypothetical protein AAES_10920 [Amazona aestiva]|uniref:Uncharacterized protein n=1 Tax=Amazona aestiva TaxID=12930 RepID=A0A0Q3X8S3_AMAAE|nr:hypothetical protein AAES_10920 [Amazona aestiva]
MSSEKPQQVSREMYLQTPLEYRLARSTILPGSHAGMHRNKDKLDIKGDSLQAGPSATKGWQWDVGLESGSIDGTRDDPEPGCPERAKAGLQHSTEVASRGVKLETGPSITQCTNRSGPWAGLK